MSKRSIDDNSLFLNNFTFVDYYDRLQMLARSLFTWENLDEVCGYGASRFLEESLFKFGRAVFVNDKNLGFKVFNATPSDILNPYGLPTKIMATSYAGTGYNEIYDFDDVVYIMNNDLIKATMPTIELFARRLYSVERTMDINLNAQKTPLIIEGDKNTLLTLKNIMLKYDGNVPVIYANKNFDVNNKLNVLKTESPYLIDKLENYKHELWNDCMSFLGINNANTSKKERLITDEVESNDDLINYYLNCFYKTRKHACDLINKKFLANSDKKIKVVLNKDVLDLLAETKQTFNKGEVQDGSIHDNNQDIDGQ